MELAILALQFAALAVLALGLLGVIAGHWYTWHYFSHYARNLPTDYAPAVSIIKPNRGVDSWTADNFQRFCKQVYPNRYEVIFAVEDAADPSVPIIEQLQRDLPDRDIRLVYSDSLKSHARGKLRNLIAGVRASHYSVLVLADSDVQVEPDWLAKAVQPLSDPQVGLAFAVPVYRGARDWAAAMLAAGVNDTLLHSGSTASRKRIKQAVGSAMVLRRDVLDAIGGLEPFSRRFVGIDISISQAIFEKGYQLHLLGEPAQIVHPHSSFSDWWYQVHRWMVTIRKYYPRITPLMFLFGIPLWWALLFWGLFAASGGDAGVGALPLIVFVVGHIISLAIINIRLVHDSAFWRYLWVIPIVDLLTLPLSIHAVLSDRVLWGGRWVRIHRDLTGEIVQPVPASK